MGGIFQFFTTILAKITAVANWVLAVIRQLFLDAWNIITDIICWAFESVLGVAASALSSIEAPFDPQTYYSMIPAETANVLGLIGVPQGISMIVGSLLIRFVLQTIPFVRWGS